MRTETAINIVFLQVLWFASILGAAHRWMTPALIWFGLFVCWNIMRSGHAKQDISIVLLATPLGFALDTLWIRLGWLEFSHTLPFPGVAPLWIAMLWAGLALTINHSLRWLQSRPGLAAAFSLLSGPLSYYAAARLGAVQINEPYWLLTSVGLSWAVFLPGLLLFARNLDKSEFSGQHT